LDNKNKESDAFVIDMQEKNDVLCWVPWGDTVMWGPTETSIDSLEELPVNAEDVSFLLRKLNVNTKATFTKKDILNVRTGIRPLVKKNDKKVEYSLDMSRKALIEKDSKLPWFTIFGGKISGSLGFSLKVFKKVFASAPKLNEIDYSLQVPMSTEYFDGLSLPSVEWCVTNTQVRCLEDYLRRRTNVAQWIPMGGLGFDQGYKSDLKKLAFLIHVNPEDAESDFKDYIQRQIKERQTWEN
jgi:glycerol-3-phosphate dehydrogenase